jgi:hypothetical protein
MNEAIAKQGYYRAVDVALALPGNHRVFCEDFAWCSAVVGRPRMTVWWDGRADPYPIWVWDEARAVAADQPRGSTVADLDRYKVDVSINRREAPMNLALVRAGWQIKYADLRYIVWERV